MWDPGPLPVGVVLGSGMPPEDLLPTAALVEELGFGELWLPEDYLFTGAMASAGAILTATERIPVGLGVVSAMVRHPAVLAMELATLDRLAPGRLIPGLGLGVPAWLRQMGLSPRSALGAMRECIAALRTLLDGGELNQQGEYFAFHDMTLMHTPERRIPLTVGAIGPRMLQLSGELADGTVASILANPRYVTWARERIAEGQSRADREDERHPLTCFALYSVDHDAAVAKEAIREAVAFAASTMTDSLLPEVSGISDELSRLAPGGVGRIAADMPDSWVDELAVAGDADECVAKIARLMDAGADSVMLFPFPPGRTTDMLELTATRVLPRLRAALARGPAG
jgi:5,10-methylenetetrahydromethanopterin reductase